MFTANGTVSCLNPCKNSVNCDWSDFSSWPFDIHQCNFEYVSNVHLKTVKLLNQSITVDEENAAENNEWKLLSVAATGGEMPLIIGDSRVIMMSRITYTFRFQRISDGYLFQIIVPAFVIVTINIFLMLLNPQLPERFVLYTINLFSHFIFLEQLRWM